MDVIILVNHSIFFFLIYIFLNFILFLNFT